MIAKAGPSNDCMEVTAPYDGAPIATIDMAHGDAVGRALSTAYPLFRDRSRWSDNEQRVDILRRAERRKRVPLFYRLTDKSGQWRVYDVVIEGISMVRNYRGQFRQILSTKKPEDLLQTLRERTKAKPAG